MKIFHNVLVVLSHKLSVTIFPNLFQDPRKKSVSIYIYIYLSEDCNSGIHVLLYLVKNFFEN